MKFVIQRVTSGKVSVNNEVVGSIGPGLMVLVGITHKDTEEYIDHAVEKLLNLRLFDDDKGNRWKESLKTKNYGLLLVSQFTLYHILKGNKPDFHSAMDGDKALEFFNKIVQKAKDKYIPEKVQTGKFGEHMYIDVQLDGPVTIEWEYPGQNLLEQNAKVEEKKKGGNKQEKKDDNKKNENKKQKQNKKGDKKNDKKEDDKKEDDKKEEDKKEDDKKEEDKKEDDKKEEDKKEE